MVKQFPPQCILQPANNHSLTSYWLAVTDVLTDSAQTELAQQILLKAAESAETIQAKYEKAESLIEVAYRLARVNDSKASERFALALDTISQLTQYEKAVSLLRLDERFIQPNRKTTEDEPMSLKQVLNIK